MSRIFPAAEDYDESRERVVIEEAQQGSGAAIESLIKKHQHFVYDVALKLVRDQEDAADLTQEVLVKVLTKLPLFSFKSSFRTWLYRIVVNQFLNTKRRKIEKDLYPFEALGEIANDLYKDVEMSLAERSICAEEIRYARDKRMASTLLCLDRRKSHPGILENRCNGPKKTRSRLLSSLFDQTSATTNNNLYIISFTMSATKNQEYIQEVYGKLHFFSLENKVLFIEILLFQFTISGRGIWSDEKSTDKDKSEAFKWLNELYHRIWNIRFELLRGEDDESITRLFQNLKIYGEESEALRIHIIPTVLLAFKSFEKRKK